MSFEKERGKEKKEGINVSFRNSLVYVNFRGWLIAPLPRIYYG